MNPTALTWRRAHASNAAPPIPSSLVGGEHVRRGSTWRRSAKVVRVHLDEGLRPLEVEPRYQHALLVVLSRDGFLGQVGVPAEPVLTVERQWDAITRELEDRLWERQVRDTFIRAVGGLGDERPDRSDPSVSVIVCTRDRPSNLRSCLDSISALGTRPVEVIGVDNSPSDGATRELCRDYPVRYVLESSPGLARARNRGIVEARGEVVAFTDDDCVVDRHWLDGLGDPFHDPLVMALTGYAGPLELETLAQYLFEVRGGFQRFSERRLFDGASSSPISVAAAAGAGANSLFRRRVFDEVGLFAEDLGPGTPARNGEEKYAFYRIAAAGYRIVFDPVRIVWHRHRTEHASLRRTLFGYTTGEFAYTTRCLLAHGELGTLDLWRWWCRHLAGDLRRWIRDDERALPLDAILAEAAGLPVGPWKLWRSRRTRRSTPALATAEGRRFPDAQRAPRVGAEAPRLSVVIASRNRRERLRQVLAGLADQRYPADRCEAVVVLDGSSDGSPEMVRGLELPYRVALFEQEHSGVATCRNRGAHEASHPVVLFLDDDVLPGPEFPAGPGVVEPVGLRGSRLVGGPLPAQGRAGTPVDLHRLRGRQRLHAEGAAPALRRLRRELQGPAPGLGTRDSPARRRRHLRLLPERQGTTLPRPPFRDGASARAPGGQGRCPAGLEAPTREGPASARRRGGIGYRGPARPPRRLDAPGDRRAYSPRRARRARYPGAASPASSLAPARAPAALARVPARRW